MFIKKGTEFMDEIKEKNAIKHNAIVPQIIKVLATKQDRILDFSAGKRALHTRELRTKGYKVKAHEFGSNFSQGLHNAQALDDVYDFVFASNVLNIQPNVGYLHSVLLDLAMAKGDDGVLVVNYPLTPRKNDVSTTMLYSTLMDVFDSVVMVRNKGVFICQ